ncbi:hypothetical protein CJF30_00000426 [Rutstroemia sp. NJR-2017a BBW]|nr:hypothetical protein CJF30_00000426 [Rutstroemia sp. NJR-2017a BBW]
MASTPLPTVLITGCSDHGIGSALAHAFHSHNYHIYACVRATSQTTSISTLQNIDILTLDVTSPSQIQSVVDTIRDKGRGLDILVNNAAGAHFSPVLDVDIEEAKALFEVNVWGPLRLVKACVPLLREGRESGKGVGGMVVNVTSLAGRLNVPFMAPTPTPPPSSPTNLSHLQGLYSSSKAALELLTETLRLELQPFSIKVLSVITGAVHSQGQSHFDNYALPASSLYLPIEHTIAERARGNDGRPREDTAVYAESVVRDILKGAEGKIWHGADAGAMKWMVQVLPGGMMDKAICEGTGLDRLGKGSA